MSKALIAGLVMCMALSAAMAADVTAVFEPIKDMGMDQHTAGPHHNRGADNQFRFCKDNEFGVFEFDRNAIKASMNATLTSMGMTLQDALNQGAITVKFSVVPSSGLDVAENQRPVHVTDVYSTDNWVEGGGTGGTGSDDDWNWPGGAPPVSTAFAATPSSPADGIINGVLQPGGYDPLTGGGGAWTDSSMSRSPQQFSLITTGATYGNAADFDLSTTPWATGARSYATLGDSLWCEYIYGLNSSTLTPTFVTDGLKTFGDDGSQGGAGLSANMACYSKEQGLINGVSVRPQLTITIAGVTQPKYIHAHDGDTNNDGACNVVDLGVLAKYYDSTGLPTSAVDPFGAGSWQKADFNNDGNVNVVDLGVLAKNYDWVGAPAVPTPEPLTLSLLAVGGLALIRRRK